MKKILGLSFLFLAFGMPAWACVGTSKLVGVITHKSPPTMHVRSCIVRLEVPSLYESYDIGSIHPQGPYYEAETSFQCEGVYEQLEVGFEVVGNVSWFPMVSRDGKVRACLPSFELYGLIEKL